MNSISQRALYGDSMDLFEYDDDDDSILEVETFLAIQIDPENSILYTTEPDLDNTYLPVE